MGKRYVSSDWHGNLKLAEAALSALNPDDILFFLGDANDRGENGIEIIEKLLNDDRVFYLMGNHEQFIIDYFQGLFFCDTDVIYYWGNNGGNPTMQKLLDIGSVEARVLVNKLKNLPKRVDLCSGDKKIILTHAGTDPWYDERELKLRGRGGDPYLWDRKHIDMKWNPAKEWENTIVIHGHTPVHFFSMSDNSSDKEWNSFVPTCVHYADGHKIDIDMGTPSSNRIVLLDLDTFEEKYIDIE